MTNLPPGLKNQSAHPDRRRGRPRSVQARRAILAAARELLLESGLSSLTIEGIAARAGVGKPTIYRTWRNAHAVAMAALMESGQISPAPDSNERDASAAGLAGLRNQLHEIAAMFATPLGRNAMMLVAAAERDTEQSKAFRHHFILARRNEGRAFLAAAVADADLRRDLDIEVAVDLIYAPVFYRLLTGHLPVTLRFVDDVLNTALQGLAAQPRRKPW